MDNNTALVFTRCEMGDALAGLQQLLAKFLGLLDDASLRLSKILFYIDGGMPDIIEAMQKEEKVVSV